MNNRETRNEPIPGNVVDTEWVDVGIMLVTVESDGETWIEHYEFVEAERVDEADAEVLDE